MSTFPRKYGTGSFHHQSPITALLFRTPQQLLAVDEDNLLRQWNLHTNTAEFTHKLPHHVVHLFSSQHNNALWTIDRVDIDENIGSNNASLHSLSDATTLFQFPTDSLGATAVSADRTTIATAWRELHVLDHERKPKQHPLTLDFDCTLLSLSAQGSFAFVGGENTVQLLDLHNGTTLQRWETFEANGAFSPDEKLFVLIEGERVRVFETNTLTTVFEARMRIGKRAYFTPDGASLLLTESEERQRTRCLDVKSKFVERWRVLHPATHYWIAGAVSPDGNTFALAEGCRIRCFSIATGEERSPSMNMPFPAHSIFATNEQLTTIARSLVSDATVLRTLDAKEPQRVLGELTSLHNAWCFDPEGNLFDGANLWHPPSLSFPDRLRSGSQTNAVAISPNGRIALALASSNDYQHTSLLRFELVTEERRKPLFERKAFFGELCFLSNQRFVLATNEPGIEQHNLRSSSFTTHLTELGRLHRLTRSPHGKTLAALDRQQHLVLIHSKDLTLRARAPKKTIGIFAFTPCGRWIIAALYNTDTLLVLSTRSGRRTKGKQLQAPGAPITAISFAPNGDLLLGRKDCSIDRIPSQELPFRSRRIPTTQNPLEALRSLREELFQSFLREGVGPAHRTASERVLRTHRWRLTHDGSLWNTLTAVAVSPNGRWISAGGGMGENYGRGGALQTWEVRKGCPIRSIEDIEAGINQHRSLDQPRRLQWNPEGTLIAAPYGMTNLGVWNPLLATSPPSPDCYAFHSDGSDAPDFAWHPEEPLLAMTCLMKDNNTGLVQMQLADMQGGIDWDDATWFAPEEGPRRTQHYTQLWWGKNGEQLVCQDRNLIVRNGRTGATMYTVDNSEFFGPALSHDGTLLASVTFTATELRDLRTGALRWKAKSPAFQQVFSFSDRHLARVRSDRIELLDVQDGSITRSFSCTPLVPKPHGCFEDCLSVAFSRDDQFLAVLTQNEFLVWNLREETNTPSFRSETRRPCFGLAFGETSDALVLWSDQSIEFWNRTQHLRTYVVDPSEASNFLRETSRWPSRPWLPYPTAPEGIPRRAFLVRPDGKLRLPKQKQLIPWDRMAYVIERSLLWPASWTAITDR